MNGSTPSNRTRAPLLLGSIKASFKRRAFVSRHVSPGDGFRLFERKKRAFTRVRPDSISNTFDIYKARCQAGEERRVKNKQIAASNLSGPGRRADGV